MGDSTFTISTIAVGKDTDHGGPAFQLIGSVVSMRPIPLLISQKRDMDDQGRGRPLSDSRWSNCIFCSHPAWSTGFHWYDFAIWASISIVGLSVTIIYSFRVSARSRS